MDSLNKGGEDKRSKSKDPSRGKKHLKIKSTRNPSRTLARQGWAAASAEGLSPPPSPPLLLFFLLEAASDVTA